MKRTIVQIVVIVVAALVLAVTANALASRDRKVTLIGWYPNATTVTPREPEPAAAQPAAPAPTPTTTTAEAAVATQVVATTTTVAPAPVNPATQQLSNPATEPNTKHPLNPAAQQPTAQPRNPATPQPTPDITTRFPAHPDKPYIEIAYDDVAALHAKGVLFLDARRTSVYEQGHISGARPYSVWESDLDDKVRKLFDERSDPAAQALPVVVYCSGGDCEDSHMLAQKLWGIQFNNVYVYKDGFPDWEKHHAATTTGANP